MGQPKTKAKKKTKPALPHWDLSDLVPKPADRHIAKGLARAGKQAAAFRKAYAGRVVRLAAPALAKAIVQYEKISEDIGRYYSYASLDRQTKLSDAKAGALYQTVMERATDIGSDMLFFTLDINKIPDRRMAALLKNAALAKYRPWLDQVRSGRPHQLADNVEAVLHERSVTGRAAWVRLFDETMARLRFDVGGREVTETEVFHLMSHKSPAVRKKAAKAVEKTMGDNIQTFATIMNTLVKDKDISDRQRKYKTVLAARNLDNQVEDETVGALVTAVEKSYKDLSHRYYRLKARWLGMRKMNYWDRNAPLPFASDRKIGWDAAQEAVLSAYTRFHPRLGAVAQQFFDRGWIDAEPRAGKDSGAFSASTVPSAHPYILMNYKGELHDVMTLAHEMGHGVHQVLSGKQGYLMADTPLTLAETASVFGEMLTFRHYLDTETNQKNRKAMLAKKVEDMLNTAVRQIAFHTFEYRVHMARKKGELSAEQISDIWMQVMAKSLGPAFTFDPGYRYFWAYIPHFIHTPFYVYAYAFGDCLVNALYGAYQQAAAAGHAREFADKYIRLLEAGGTQHHSRLLAPFGLDARDPRFWRRGLSVISGFIDELEAMR